MDNLLKSWQESLNAAAEVPITKFRQVRKYRLNKPRTIPITFLYNYDKSYLLNAKKHLPDSVFVENEFPKEVQQSCTILRPVLKLVNKTDSYKGKWKMEGHHLVIKGTKYDISNIHELLSEISGMVATQKQMMTQYAILGNSAHLATSMWEIL